MSNGEGEGNGNFQKENIILLRFGEEEYQVVYTPLVLGELEKGQCRVMDSAKKPLWLVNILIFLKANNL